MDRATPPTVHHGTHTAFLQCLVVFWIAYETREGHPPKFSTLIAGLRRTIRRKEYRGKAQDDMLQLLHYLEAVYDDPDVNFVASDHRDWKKQ